MEGTAPRSAKSRTFDLSPEEIICAYGAMLTDVRMAGRESGQNFEWERAFNWPLSPQRIRTVFEGLTASQQEQILQTHGLKDSAEFLGLLGLLHRVEQISWILHSRFQTATAPKADQEIYATAAREMLRPHSGFLGRFFIKTDEKSLRKEYTDLAFAITRHTFPKRLVIYSAKESRERTAEHPSFGAAISIRNPPEGNPEEDAKGYGPPLPGRKTLIQHYFDIDRRDVGYLGEVTKADPAPLGPKIEHVVDALDAANGFFERNHVRKLLIHCWAGKRRSTATALAILADAFGPGREDEAVKALLEIRPEAAPNFLLVEYADHLLQRHGALMAAIKNNKILLAKYLAHDPKKAWSIGPQRTSRIVRELMGSQVAVPS